MYLLKDKVTKKNEGYLRFFVYFALAITPQIPILFHATTQIMQWLLSKILWHKQSKWQFALAAGGFVAGLLILLASLQIYLDIEAILSPQKQQAGSEFLILNKEINLANMLKISSSEFTSKEIEDLKAQPFVKQIGFFTSNQFESSVRATDLIPFRTVMFFEAVPDKFLDVVPPEWTWSEHSDFVPMMVSQDFINLYNFGFALSQGLPQIPKESVKLVPLTVTISGTGGSKTYNARIVGFSDRIATVLIPEKFMLWANQNIGQRQAENPSRIIVETANASDASVAEYLKKHHYTTNQDKLRASKASGIFQAVMSLIGVLGLFFVALSVVIFLMNFRLIIAEAQEEIRLLLQLGYKVATLAKHLLVYFSAGLLLSVLAAVVALQYLLGTLRGFMHERGLEAGTNTDIKVWFLAASILFGCWAVSALSVWRLLLRSAK